jgi:hypothetical protein
VPIEEVKELTNKDYVAEGTTALLDAMGESLTKMAKIPELKDNKDVQVIVVIITDGMENASREYKKAGIKQMVSEHQEKDGWKFVFLGANIDAAAEAGRMGIRADRATQYVSDDIGTHIAYEAMANAQVSRRTTGSVAASWNEAPMADAAARSPRRFKLW